LWGGCGPEVTNALDGPRTARDLQVVSQVPLGCDRVGISGREPTAWGPRFPIRGSNQILPAGPVSAILHIHAVRVLPPGFLELHMQ